MLQHYITGLTYTNSVVGNIGDQIDRYFAIRDGLGASNCPWHFITKIAERCQEDRGPEGLANLENRRENHQSLVLYVLRILPITMTAKSCVVMLGCDNRHMPENLRPGIGMAIIFDDGVVEAMA
ncbi:E3 ubiquitin-protein ligase NRDP1-like [Drosophila tropicalis]|uniref:E3 ubiquitin-protein ligase NRDP1-like n=1 Tax=Drosophila tropicalis TaxID=46794 RepID=UPI0035AC1AB2